MRLHFISFLYISNNDYVMSFASDMQLFRLLSQTLLLSFLIYEKNIYILRIFLPLAF